MNVLKKLSDTADQLDNLQHHSLADELDGVITRVTAKAKSKRRPPKQWFDEKAKEVREGMPEYTEKQVAATVGHIWWEEMSAADRERAIERGK